MLRFGIRAGKGRRCFAPSVHCGYGYMETLFPTEVVQILGQ